MSLPLEFSCYDPGPLVRAGIHPPYQEIKVACACGASFSTRSTRKTDLRLEICSACHPFFTGKQRIIDSTGRVERFRQKFGQVQSKRLAKQQSPQAAS